MSDNLLPEFLALADSLAEPRLFIGADYRVLAVNRAWREAFGDPGESGRHFCYEISHHADAPCDQMGEDCPLKASRENDEPARALHIHHTPHGPEHVDVEVSPIRNGAGHTLFFVETVRIVRRARSRPSAHGLVGRSQAFNRMLSLIERVAPSEATVLLLGESGVGKELAAQALHEASGRASSPFIAVDCAGMTETLVGSELFGHEKGAFTGAISRKTGLVEAAAGGTLFFDEVGDIPLCLQVKLLRLIESGTFRRVGGLEPLRADFRLVLATHRNLEAMMEEGSFRRDLYYRISAFPIRVPPLRERDDDLPLLVESLLTRVSRRKLRLHPEALDRLARHPFPGNVRELRNLIERAALLADGDTILPEHLPEKIVEPTAESSAEGDIVPLIEAERRYLRWAASRHKGDRHALAERLGISPRTLFRKLREG
ncbi:MAG: sigma-54-dependent Fis family transcriptional regulator [Candidatus Nitricoxidivorans perseverans]|uniref:Sigma-54-dependent Fis family transcriptional regulator n=1 Tax=Candidatus Nitricoxidivorans perseverans TaxID=2975601 RepID=A0AA49IZW6_9PROT|nr:MAG: sigma-54-dependent Fis family transcriptional regulator [Candidatus Nitricoxidivorans perseverans]